VELLSILGRNLYLGLRVIVIIWDGFGFFRFGKITMMWIFIKSEKVGNEQYLYCKWLLAELEMVQKDIQVMFARIHKI